MRILFCSPCPLDPRLGAARILMGLAEGLTRRGAVCELVGPDTLPARGASYADRLQRHLARHAASYDVVDFDYESFVLARGGMPRDVLFVARAQLLQHHFPDAAIRPSPGLRPRLRQVVLGWRDRRDLRRRIARFHPNFEEADAVTVLNARDADVLAARGIPRERIAVVPGGLGEEQARRYAAVREEAPAEPVVGFVGMYGPRKGSGDFPTLVRRVAEAVPAARFRLLGTRGRYRDAASVLRLFPRRLQQRVEVVPTFAPDDLPGLLAACSVGVFPSYVEGFGLGVLEMLAASVPVIAYDVPGPTEMLPAAYVVPPGDAAAMADRVVALLRDGAALRAARAGGRRRSEAFTWDAAAASMEAAYASGLRRLRRLRRPVVPVGDGMPHDALPHESA